MSKGARYSFLFWLGDWIAGSVGWTLFYLYRRLGPESEKFGYRLNADFDTNYYIALLLMPAMWTGAFWLLGSYQGLFKQSRMKILGQTLVVSFLGSVLLFFALVLDDEVSGYNSFRLLFVALMVIHLSLFVVVRMLIMTYIKRGIKRRKLGFNTLIVGQYVDAKKLYESFEKARYSEGYLIQGYVNYQEEQGEAERVYNGLRPVGKVADIGEIIQQKSIEVVIIANHSINHEEVSKLITELEEANVVIKLVPDTYDVLSGAVKMDYLWGTALVEVNKEMMPQWQKNVKRVIDLVASIVVLILLSPLLLLLAMLVGFGSKGGVFYTQERVGKNRVPFRIIKFRSMVQDAERAGPQLSSENDPRITKVGRVLRKYRLDELPQFINVLKGDMALVGPRPERQHFIEIIEKEHPEYHRLHRVKPGITSWGMIKFGYAENVEEMVSRMYYDLLYVENRNLGMDIKILFYTVVIIVQGRGK